MSSPRSSARQSLRERGYRRRVADRWLEAFTARLWSGTGPILVRTRDGRSERLDDTLHRESRRLMLPHANHRPSCPLKKPVGVRISFLIPGNLRNPVLNVARWRGVVLAAPMPEASIYEY